VIGTGEHTRGVMEAAGSDSARWNVLGFVAASPCQETVERQRLPILESDKTLVKYPKAALILGIGSVRVKQFVSAGRGEIGYRSERKAVRCRRSLTIERGRN
jgi:hypothetical protein